MDFLLGQENQTPVCSREEKQQLKGVFRLCVCADFSRTQNKKSSGEIDPRRENEALPGPVPSAINAFVGKNAEFTVHLQGDWSIQSIGSNCLSLGPFSFHRADILKI